MRTTIKWVKVFGVWTMVCIAGCTDGTASEYAPANTMMEEVSPGSGYAVKHYKFASGLECVSGYNVGVTCNWEAYNARKPE